MAMDPNMVKALQDMQKRGSNFEGVQYDEPEVLLVAKKEKGSRSCLIEEKPYHNLEVGAGCPIKVKDETGKGELGAGFKLKIERPISR